ncbi:hypothetical protein FKP32DRAFT_1680468 [Trametes sanguinea]|nr:hypothetical protein FKP32DRAFT_1680468 [Trametes sanguinea]
MFQFDIRARGSDIAALSLQPHLERHLRNTGLQLRGVEDVQLRPEAIGDYFSFNYAWQFLTLSSKGRSTAAVTVGGPQFHPQHNPHSSALKFATLNQQADRIPALPPPDGDKRVILIAPVKRVLVGPLWRRRDASLPPSPEHPLHLCLGLRAWPQNQIVLEEVMHEGVAIEIVPCMPSCEDKLLITDAELHDDGPVVFQAATTSSSPTESWHNDTPSRAEDNAATMPSSGTPSHLPASAAPLVPAPASAPAPPAFLTTPSTFSSSSISALSSVPSAPPVRVVVPPLSETPSSAPLAESSLPPVSTVSSAMPTSVCAPASHGDVYVNDHLPSSSISASTELATHPPPSTPSSTISAAVARTGTTSGGVLDLARALRYLQDASEETNNWISYLRSFQPLSNEAHGIKLEAPTVEQAAQTLLHAVKCVASGGLADTMDDSVELLSFQESQFHYYQPRVDIGEAVGQGPLRGVFSRAMRIMVSDDVHWMPTSGSDEYIPLIPGTPFEDGDITYFKACGIMLRLALLWDQDILPVSPMLLVLLIGGLDATTDRDLLEVMAPSLAARLASWPPPLVDNSSGRRVFDVQLGQDPMNLVMEAIPNVQVMHIRNLSPEGAEAFGKKLIAALLFQTSDIDHPFFKALRDGLEHHTLTRDARRASTSASDDGRISTTLLQTFENRPVAQIVAGLFAARRPASYAILLPLIDSNMSMVESSPHYDSNLAYNTLADRWMLALQRYLAGSGHPNHEAFSAMSTTESVALGEAFRPTLFLQAISDSEYLPRGSLNGYPKFLINFVCVLPHGVLASFHTCMKTMDVLLNREVEQMLEGELPEDPSETTIFDVYLHSLLITSRNVYNAI